MTKTFTFFIMALLTLLSMATAIFYHTQQVKTCEQAIRNVIQEVY